MGADGRYQGVILAAGRGTRLGTLGRTRSKATLPILGVPIVVRVMQTLQAIGIREFIVVRRPDDHEIEPSIRAWQGEGVAVHLVRQERPAGTAHALSCAVPLIRGDFVLSACDSLLPEQEAMQAFSRWDRSTGSEALMCLAHVSPQALSEVGVVVLEGPWVQRVVEKPGPARAPSAVASLPHYGFPLRFLDYLPRVPVSARGEYEIQDAIQQFLAEGGRARGVFVRGRLSLTRPEDLLVIHRQVFHTLGEDFLVLPPEVPPGVRFLPPCQVDRGVRLGSGSSIGPAVYLEGGCEVGEGAEIREAVVLRGARVTAGARVVGRVVWLES